jgi:curved DNA-binding protein CbpA|tara:strand:+ start:2879 stop:3517 length:639 start_codon:yes stop_codon:yes gene_type:complete
MTLYSVLGVREDATESSIKAAYRTAAKANHPDTNPHATPGLFAQIAEAYDVLGDKAKRVSYDYTLSLERSTVDTMQKSEWSGFETYTNKASGAKDKHHGRYHESDMKWRERTGREMAEDASAAAAWWRREKAQSKHSTIRFRMDKARAEIGRADRASDTLKSLWAAKRGVTRVDCLVTMTCVGFVVGAWCAFGANTKEDGKKTKPEADKQRA